MHFQPAAQQTLAEELAPPADKRLYLTCMLQALREAEREKARQRLVEADRQDLTYLKNILLKLFETGAPLLLVRTLPKVQHKGSVAAAISSCIPLALRLHGSGWTPR